MDKNKSTQESSPNSTTPSSPCGGENNSFIYQAVLIAEKKVRNLEKRKAKLDGYIVNSHKGKELNEDQKSAMSKYDQVLQNLELACEFCTQLRGLAADEDKHKKKAARKAIIEKYKNDIKKMADLLKFQDLLDRFDQADFTRGTNGAAKLSLKSVNAVEELKALVGVPNHYKAAEAWNNLLEGKSKTVDKEVSFNDIRSILEEAKSSGYYDKKEKTKDEEAITSTTSSPRREHKQQTSQPCKHAKESKHFKEQHSDKKQQQHQNEDTKITNESKKQLSQAHQESKSANQVAQDPQQNVLSHPERPQPETSMQHTQPLPAQVFMVNRVPVPNYCLPTQQSHAEIQSAIMQQPENVINFLQQSQISVEAQQVDPAVIVVQQSSPQQVVGTPTQSFTNQLFITPTTAMQQQQIQQHHMQLHMQQHPLHEPSIAPGSALPQPQPPLRLVGLKKYHHARKSNLGEAILSPPKPTIAKTEKPNDSFASISDWNEENSVTTSTSDTRHGKGIRSGKGTRGGKKGGIRDEKSRGGNVRGGK